MPEPDAQSKTKADRKRLVATNVLLWVLAALTHPLSHLIPTSTGEPPKILPLFIFWFFIMLGWVSTMLLLQAIGKPSDE